MRILFGDDDGGAGDGRARSHDPGDDRGSRSRDLCHRVRVRSGDLIFVSADAVVPVRGEIDLAITVLSGGNGVDCNRYPKKVELVSAKQKSPNIRPISL
ncbi:hypothetical protein L195_g060026 [Trifolium pratense]|uniref:Uncharacterized protein n=1 Tax=Trifolium pratense TaxID=57577 RepID=A0A2K3K1I3_TRIPR|nr:hypothetical protein L195_g060026 [Trifolium pratense]